MDDILLDLFLVPFLHSVRLLNRILEKNLSKRDFFKSLNSYNYNNNILDYKSNVVIKKGDYTIYEIK